MNLNLKKLQEKMPKLHLHLKVEKDGEVIFDSYQIGHSWTKNAYNFYNLQMLYGTTTSNLYMRSTNGTMYNASNFITFYYQQYGGFGYYNSAVNDVTCGIVLGSDDTAFHIDDYRLYVPILSGNTSGTLYAQAQGAPVQSFSGSPDNTENILYSRVFNNNSGGTITVKEVGLYTRANIYACFSRDVLESAVNVLDGAQLTVTVSITTQDLTDLYYIPPDLWTAGMGGYYLGQITRADDTTGGFHHRYVIIVAPKTGGELSAAAISTSNDVSSLASVRNNFYGAPETAAIIALGADSPMGIACAAQNTAVLGGYSDWYIPSIYEAELFYINRTYIPSGQEFANEYYRSSTYSSNPVMYVVHPITGAIANDSTDYYANQSYKTRLVRRILLADWVAD